MAFIIETRETCALCLRALPKTALVSKPWVTVAGHTVVRFYCADALACIEATRLMARHPS